MAAVAFGTGALLGSALGAFFHVNVSIYHSGNVTVLGPGPNERCSGPFIVGLQAPSIYAEAGGSILGPNNTSDLAEPHFALGYPGIQSGQYRVAFDNSFVASNQTNVTTCGGPSQSFPSVSSRFLQVGFPVTISGENYTIPFVLTIVQTFHYVFPANFGTWQVDNLSAPGGPGGGWAFSYSPCP